MKIDKIKCEPATFGNNTKPGSKYSNFRETIRNKTNKIRIENKEVNIRIKLFIKKGRTNRSDLDNYLKPIVDGLSDFKDKWNPKIKKGVIKDESQIKSIFIEKITTEEEGVGIEIK